MCLVAAQLLFVIAVDKTGNKVRTMNYLNSHLVRVFHTHAGSVFSHSPGVAVSVLGQFHVDANGRGGPLCGTDSGVH